MTQKAEMAARKAAGSSKTLIPGAPAGPREADSANNRRSQHEFLKGFTSMMPHIGRTSSENRTIGCGHALVAGSHSRASYPGRPGPKKSELFWRVSGERPIYLRMSTSVRRRYKEVLRLCTAI